MVWAHFTFFLIQIEMKLPLCLLSSVVHSHSWIACTDYGEKNGRYYDVDKCRAWPRRAWDLVPKTEEFGLGGSGFAKAINDDESPCKVSAILRVLTLIWFD